MKFRNPLDDILGQKTKVKIIRMLTLKGLELTGRQIASETRLSPPACHTALGDLVLSHVVLERRAGNSHLFKLNQGNHLVQALLKPLFEKEETLLASALEELLKKIPWPIISVILYGSLVKKTESSRSDIDLLIIVSPRHRTGVDKSFDNISSAFLAKYGRVLAPYVIGLNDFLAKYKKREPFIVEAVKTGIVIKGKLISEIINHGR